MDDLIESFGNIKQRLVFILDGTTRIRDWIENAFPDAISILDYFHVIEHLHEFIDSYFKEKKLQKNGQKNKRKVQEMKKLIHKFDVKIKDLGLQA